MKDKQKEIIWINIVIAFYLITGFWDVYDITQMVLWPIFAVPMAILLIKTHQKEMVALLGAVLAVVISFLTKGKFDPVVISSFLLFVLAPAFVFGVLYINKVEIPRIILATTLTIFLSGIVFLTFSKLLGIDYLELYFSSLDAVQNIWNDYLIDPEMQKMLPGGEKVITLYAQNMGRLVLQAKRTYPATLFTSSLMGSTVYLLIIQLIARIRYWERPSMKEILNIALSPVSVWVLLGLWIAYAQMGNTDTHITFAIESMLVVLFIMFQIVGLISIIVMTMKLGGKKIMRILLIIISIFWLIFNPILLVIIGCMDSLFNFRKVKTLI